MFAIPESAVYLCYNHAHATIEAYRSVDYYIDAAGQRYDRRKPGPGMLLEAMRDFGCTAEKTLFVGDRDEDKQAAMAAGCHYIAAWEFFGDFPSYLRGPEFHPF